MLTIGDLYGTSKVEFTVLDDEANMLSVMNCATHDSHSVSDKPTTEDDCLGFANLFLQGRPFLAKSSNWVP